MDSLTPPYRRIVERLNTFRRVYRARSLRRERRGVEKENRFNVYRLQGLGEQGRATTKKCRSPCKRPLRTRGIRVRTLPEDFETPSTRVFSLVSSLRTKRNFSVRGCWVHSSRRRFSDRGYLCRAQTERRAIREKANFPLGVIRKRENYIEESNISTRVASFRVSLRKSVSFEEPISIRSSLRVRVLYFYFPRSEVALVRLQVSFSFPLLISFNRSLVVFRNRIARDATRSRLVRSSSSRKVSTYFSYDWKSRRKVRLRYGSSATFRVNSARYVLYIDESRTNRTFVTF